MFWGLKKQVILTSLLFFFLKYKMEDTQEQKVLKEENLNEDNKKEKKMPRKKSSIKPIVDGWGLIITIVGLALFILGSNNKSSFNVGLIILIIGFIRMLYVLVKHGR